MTEPLEMNGTNRRIPPAEIPQGEVTKTTCLKVKLFSRPEGCYPIRCLELLCNGRASRLLLKDYPDHACPVSYSPDNNHRQAVILDSDDADETVPVDTPRALRERVQQNNAHGSLPNGHLNAATGGEGKDVRTLAAIGNFLDSYRSRNLSQATIDWYRNILKKFCRACPTFPKGPEPIEAFLAGVKGSPETKHDYFRALKTFFKFTAERRETANPMAKVRVQRPKDKLRPTLDDKQLHHLLNSATTLRDNAILTLLVDTGIRSGELVGLRVQDIREETIIVRGKTGEREVPISEQTYRLLQTLIASQPGQEHVFLGHKGPLGKHGIFRIVRLHMRKAGIKGPKLGAHRIRHGFGKNYLVSGGDLRSLQELMGHKRITTTEIYTHLSTKEIIDKHHQFTPLRAARAAAQEKLWKDEAVKEAQDIITNRKDH